jgi:hypothetical protein
VFFPIAPHFQQAQGIVLTSMCTATMQRQVFGTLSCLGSILIHEIAPSLDVSAWLIVSAPFWCFPCL